ncbi:hypothetical protein [Carboxylicivirga taeanensis]|uniref:hypothetical protein n=1 Tax=Carboxylicivirga taeanensis TaxID=1416875 RepID=UPI003F6E0B5B
MAKRDPEKTARNKIDKQMSATLKQMLPAVLAATGFDSEYSLHGKIGGKFADYIDIRDAVIHSQEHFISLWLQGYKKKLESGSGFGNAYETYDLLCQHQVFKDYLFLFLRRTYLRNYDALSKIRPTISEAEIWIGQQNANYGLLITPRYVNGEWENDKSEIRHFKPKYWSIGHVLETGLLIPDKNEKIEFNSVEEYLKFFKYVIVRNSGSKYEMEIAELYSDYVTNSPNQLEIPLLIPEYRYDGLQKQHKYRLDFTIIESKDLNKIGFELSPWSSHGYLKKIKGLTQKVINEMASDNFEKEMKKHKDYFKRHGIFIMIYTDSDLSNTDTLFEDMKQYLIPSNIGSQLQFHIFEDFFK